MPSLRPKHPAKPPSCAGRIAAWGAALGLVVGMSSSPAGADQLIQIPTGERTRGLRAEYLHRFEGRDEGYASLVAPLGLDYEVMSRYYNGVDGRHVFEAGGQLRLLPDGVVTPAVSLGIWDLGNSSPWGRRGFLALSKGVERGQFGLPAPFEHAQLTLGTGTGRFSGVFAGLRMDLPGNISLITEYDTRRLNLGFWISPVPLLSLKAELQNGEPLFGGELRKRF